MGMAFFPESTNRTFMYGGLDTSGNSQHDTWQWDGTTWITVDTGGHDPGTRSSTRMVYDAILHRIVLFGGKSCALSVCSFSPNSTWLLDPTASAANKWKVCSSCNSPAPSQRTSEALGYDSDNLQVVLFGGDLCAMCGEPSGNAVTDGQTWVVVATPTIRWVLKSPTPSPTPRASGTLAFLNKPLSHQMIMFGGDLGGALSATNETWQWNGATSVWTALSPQADPGRRFGHRMEYNDSLQEIVLFGSGTPSLLNDTWFWDGLTWTPCGPMNGCPTTVSPPLPRCCMGLAYDQIQMSMVVYAGAVPPSPSARPDTWLWDPTLSWRCVWNCGL